jgi:hypothetical protein
MTLVENPELLQLHFTITDSHFLPEAEVPYQIQMPFNQVYQGNGRQAAS